MKILVAPNAFKNSLSASEAADAIREGLEQSKLSAACECFPVADGGDGTGELLRSRMGAQTIEVPVSGPLGQKIKSQYGYLRASRTAIIELADASGVRLIGKTSLDPIRATTYGTGELIMAAVNNGARRILLGIGGSATVDGGAGILQAVGIKFLSGEAQIMNLPVDLGNVTSIDLSALDRKVRECEIVILCDVRNPIIGDNGAAKVFGPQKGASPGEVLKLEERLAAICDAIERSCGEDVRSLTHAGAAGGVGGVLNAVLGARLVNGIDFFLDETQFDRSLADADVVITGEGSIDEQTLEGKGPFGVALRAQLRNIPVIGIAGVVPLIPSAELLSMFTALFPIQEKPQSLDQAMSSTRENLVRTACMVGNLLAVGK